MSKTGNKINRIVIATCLFLFTLTLCAQQDILEKKIRINDLSRKTSKIIEEVTLTTGYYFTYDTKILDTDRRINIQTKEPRLREILDSIAAGQSLKYSLIGKHIILYRDDTASVTDSSLTVVPKELQICGTITDSQTGEPLPFATIAIHSKNKGTITNNNGDFILRVPSNLINDTVMISYVGYSNRFMPVRSLYNNRMVIKMDQSFISIPEIIIKAQDPVAIIYKATERIKENYGTKPALLTGFYREGIFRKQKPQIYSEAVIKVYKSPYNRSLQNDQVKVIRSRKIENLSIKDTLAIRLRAGLNTCLVLDGVKNYFDFTDPANMIFYNYHLTDMVNIDGEKAYVISFEQKPNVTEPLLKGDIYINSEDYGILFSEFELNPALISKSKESFVTKLPAGYILKPASVKYRVRYRKIDNRYFISHVRGDLEFIARNRRSLFSSHYKVFFEIAYTDYETENVQRFERDEIILPYSVFTETIKNYDVEFWKGLDFLKPEDNILDEIEELKVRMKISGIQNN